MVAVLNIGFPREKKKRNANESVRPLVMIFGRKYTVGK